MILNAVYQLVLLAELYFLIDQTNSCHLTRYMMKKVNMSQWVLTHLLVIYLYCYIKGLYLHPQEIIQTVGLCISIV